MFSHGETMDCTGSKPVGNKTIHCAHAAHGTVNLHDMIVRSCNIGVGSVALKLGPERAVQVGAPPGHWGEGRKSKSLGETRGVLRRCLHLVRYRAPPTSASVKASASRPFNSSLLTAPSPTAATRWNRMLSKPSSPKPGIETSPRSEEAHSVAASTIAFMKKALQGVVEEEHGTGGNAHVPGRTVAGKTGTAQKAGRRPLPGAASSSALSSDSPPSPIPSWPPSSSSTNPARAATTAAPSPPRLSRRSWRRGLTYLHVPLDADLRPKTKAGAPASVAE